MRTVVELSGALRSGAITSQWLAERFIAEELACRDELHPFVAVDPERVLADASAADEDLAHGIDRGPLHGILIGIKDIVDVEGMATRCGSVLTSAAPASADATAVARLRAAGAVIAGKTTTHELACGVVSAPAKNPWDPSRVPGGSSGGSAVAVATGLVPIALGSDTGGSIRIPASLCGTAGIKATYGLVPLDGVAPLSVSLDHLGPLGIGVADCAVALGVLAGNGCDYTVGLNRGVDGWRIGVLDTGPFAPMQPAVADALATAVVAYQGLGATVEPVTIPELNHVLAAEFGIIAPEAYALHRDALATRPLDIDPGIRTLLTGGAVVAESVTNRAHAARAMIAAAIASTMTELRLDALLAPTVPATAAAIDGLEQVIGDRVEHVAMSNVRTTAPFNISGQPAVNVPVGLDSGGLPIGVQIAARAGDDDLALQGAFALEQTLGLDLHTMAPARFHREDL